MLQQQIANLIAPVIEAMGFELWGFEYLPQTHSSILRIYVEGPAGITLDECALVSRQVSGVLEVEDILPGKYHLEVSSPGLDRLLFKPAHYARYIGKKVKLRLRTPLAERRNFKGRLVAADENHITVELEGDEVNTVVLTLADIDRAHIVPEF